MSALAIVADNTDRLSRAKAIVDSLSQHAQLLKRGLTPAGRIYLNIITGAMGQVASGQIAMLGIHINDSILTLIPELEKLTSSHILGKPTQASENTAHLEMKNTLNLVKSELLEMLEEIPLNFVRYEMK